MPYQVQGDAATERQARGVDERFADLVYRLLDADGEDDDPADEQQMQ